MFFYKCHFDFDTNRVEAILSDGSHLSIDCIAVENEVMDILWVRCPMGTSVTILP